MREKRMTATVVAGRRSAVLLITVLWLPILAGCSTDNLRHGFYEAFRTRNDLHNSPSERVGKQESLDYREYERLRKERSEEEQSR